MGAKLSKASKDIGINFFAIPHRLRISTGKGHL